MLSVRDTLRFYQKNVGFFVYLVVSAFLWLKLVFGYGIWNAARATKRVLQTRPEGPLPEPWERSCVSYCGDTNTFYC